MRVYFWALCVLLKWDILIRDTYGNNPVEMNRRGDNCQIHRILLKRMTIQWKSE